MVFRGNTEVVTVVGAAVENKRTWTRVRWLRCGEFYLTDSNGQSRRSSFGNVLLILVMVHEMGSSYVVITVNNKRKGGNEL